VGADVGPNVKHGISSADQSRVKPQRAYLESAKKVDREIDPLAQVEVPLDPAAVNDCLVTCPEDTPPKHHQRASGSRQGDLA
jgi:hypothetical protein